VTIPGRYELPPVPGISYQAFTDPSGGGQDSFTLAIGHRDHKTGIGVLDAIRERRPPFSPEAVVSEYAAFTKSYNGCSTVHGDRYAGMWPRERFLEHGVNYIVSEQTKSQLYVECLPLLTSGRVELLDNARLVSQFCGLERRLGRGTGREVVDHGVGGRDDVSNCAAAVLVMVAGKLTDAEKLARFLE
jgi:hypothetical protein